jgi:anthranilate synthase
MATSFTSKSGLTIRRREVPIDYDAGIGDIVDRLNAERGVFLSSGIEFPDRYSRWDIGVVNPPLELTARGDQVTVRALNQKGQILLRLLAPVLAGGGDTENSEHTENILRLEIQSSGAAFAEEERSLQPSSLTPVRRLIEEFSGFDDKFLGLYGAFGYDLIFQFDPIELSLDRPDHQRELHLYLPDQVHLLDRRKERAFRYEFDIEKDGLSSEGADTKPFEPLTFKEQNISGEIETDISTEAYSEMVNAARERMHLGDIFEVVLSRRFTAPYGGKPSELFRTMKRVNPSPYEFLIQLGDEQLIGASPEMFVRIEGRRVESCPISGTIRRGRNPMEDAENIKTLFNSDKDEVELTMCTDVDRNDKSRICEPGTIKLLGRRLIERYAGLFHTVDHVEGILREGFTGIDAFLSHMWAVTLTGAPKKNAVRIVEEMEGSSRGWYGGAIGALLLNGDVNTGITIRTVYLRNNLATYRAGSTLVFDSIGEDEAAETRTKATAFFRILGSEPILGSEQSAPSIGGVAKPSSEFSNLNIVMIDNEDSFVHTLADYFRQTGASVSTYRFGVPLETLVAANPSLVMHSPGPGWPKQFGVPGLVRQLCEAGIPQFGVCLGLQGIVEAFGGSLQVMDVPHHGKRWAVRHNGGGIFDHIPDPCDVGAYHSLIAIRDKIPDELEVTAWTDEGLVMAVRHRDLPIAAVQFHPESILSMQDDIGHRIVENVLRELTGASG